MNFCPRCGTRLHARTSGAHTRRSCASEGCGFTDYGEQSIATGAVVVRNGRYLLIQRRSPARTWWQIPGGYVEVGESIDDAIIREVFEETGVTSRVISVLGLRHAAGLPPARPVSKI
jgi:8-oxo-dGTP pyrophosphatase MutT (NUDIX family)